MSATEQEAVYCPVGDAGGDGDAGGSAAGAAGALLSAAGGALVSVGGGAPPAGAELAASGPGSAFLGEEGRFFKLECTLGERLGRPWLAP